MSSPHLSTPASNDSLTIDIVSEVAAAKGVPPDDVHPPLYETVDPDALNALFAEQKGFTRTGSVSFEYSGCAVTVENDGGIVVDTHESSARCHE